MNQQKLYLIKDGIMVVKSITKVFTLTKEVDYDFTSIEFKNKTLLINVNYYKLESLLSSIIDLLQHIESDKIQYWLLEFEKECINKR